MFINQQSLIRNGYSIFLTPIGSASGLLPIICSIETIPWPHSMGALQKALGKASGFSGCSGCPKDVSQLRLSLLLNSAMCHLKQKEPEKTLQARGKMEETNKVVPHS